MARNEQHLWRIRACTAAVVATILFRYSPFVFAPASHMHQMPPSSQKKRADSPQTALVLGSSLHIGKGGGFNAPRAVPLIDCSGAALGFFNNLRTTSALLAGAALGSLFALPSSDGKWPKVLRLLRHGYLVGMVVTFAHCIMVVFLCTIATTSIVIGSVDTKAASVKDLLSGGLFLEYATCRSFFFVSLGCFLISVACKVFANVAASNSKSSSEMLVGLGVVSFLAHTVAAQQAYINSKIASTFGNLFFLYVKVICAWLVKFNPLTGPCGLLQSTAFVAFLGFTIAGLIQSCRGK